MTGENGDEFVKTLSDSSQYPSRYALDPVVMILPLKVLIDPLSASEMIRFCDEPAQFQTPLDFSHKLLIDQGQSDTCKCGCIDTGGCVTPTLSIRWGNGVDAI